MPPDFPLDSHHAVDENVLSDQNVAILYKIVEDAESRSNVENQPFRALFAAYESVLPQHGLKTAHDRVYLRFLFRLGQKRGKEESLFESFERLLEELGIQLEFKDEGSVSLAQDEVVQNSDRIESHSLSPPKRRRRASLSAIYDEGDESTNYADNKNPVRASSQEAPNLSDQAHAHRSTAFISNPVLNSGLSPQWSEEANHPSLHTRFSTTEADPSVLKDRSQEIQFQAETEHSHGRGEAHSVEQSPSQPVTPQREHFPASALIPKFPHLYQPSRAQLFRDAETFQQHRIRAVVRDIIDKWCDAALTAHQHNEHLHRLSVARDTEILVRQAFVHWRSRLHARRYTAATDKFFARLEKRALRARDLYLLTKALTHWAQSALDEKRQRLVARQRILAVKYFYAWHDITLENQGKRQVKLLKTHFVVWKQHYIARLATDYKAESHYEQSTVKSVYWHWFWSFCERRAPEWHDRKLKQRFLISWSKQFRAQRRQIQHTARDKAIKTLRTMFCRWSSKTEQCLKNEQKQIIFRQRRTTSLAIHAWSRELRFLPLQTKLFNMADWRIAGTTFAIFVNRFRFEKQAEKLSCLRMLRNVWTNWNDQLRQRTLSYRVDRNFLLTALYRWVVATRFSLVCRFFDERKKDRFFKQWRQANVERKIEFAQLEDHWQARRRIGFVRDAFLSWRSQVRDLDRDEQIAHEFHVPKVAVETLMLWKNSSKAKRLANESADDARYFFLVRRVLRVWRERLHESKRQKRRNAYAVVRRRMKLRIAASAFQTWRGRTTQIAGQEILSQNFQQEQNLLIGTTLLSKWRHKLNGLLRKDAEASQQLQQLLLTRFLGLWVNNTEHQWAQEETAAANLGLHVQKTAFICLRRLRLRLIELRSQQGKGEVLRGSYEKRHQRNLLYGWRDKTSSHREKTSAIATLPPKARVFRRYRENEDMGATRRAEEWTELDAHDWAPSTEAQASSTPLPGYLSTPSRRASRARAIVQSTTPLGTPFQSRLRAQLNTTPRSARFGALSKSRLGIASFGSVLEESPLVPGGEKAGNDG